jgi:ribonuclease R
VTRLLDGEEGEKPPEAHHDMIRQLSVIATKLHKERIGAGALDLEVAEAWFSISEDGASIDSIQGRTRTVATGLIEECMLLANRTVAQAFLNAEIPSVFRVHEDPDPEKIAAFFRMAGIGGKGGGEFDGGAIQNALSNVEDDSRRKVLQGLLLRALQKARYAPECLGHFGLAFTAYLHFTSPIRRYPDLVVHRLVRSHLLPGMKGPKKVEELRQKLSEVCTETSLLERRALEAERDIGDALKARYMEDYVGEEFDGLITSMIGRGLFIRLGDLPVDGFLAADDLPSPNFTFDPEKMWFLESRSNQSIRLGQTVRVLVTKARMEDRRVDLALAEGGLTPSKKKTEK